MGVWWVGGSWVSECIFLYMLLCEFFLFLRKYIDKTGQTSKYFEVLLRNTKIYKILKFYLLMIFSLPPTEQITEPEIILHYRKPSCILLLHGLRKIYIPYLPFLLTEIFIYYTFIWSPQNSRRLSPPSHSSSNKYYQYVIDPTTSSQTMPPS